jgi:hypothetical protein
MAEAIHQLGASVAQALDRPSLCLPAGNVGGVGISVGYCQTSCGVDVGCPVSLALSAMSFDSGTARLIGTIDANVTVPVDVTGVGRDSCSLNVASQLTLGAHVLAGPPELTLHVEDLAISFAHTEVSGCGDLASDFLTNIVQNGVSPFIRDTIANAIAPSLAVTLSCPAP